MQVFQCVNEEFLMVFTGSVYTPQTVTTVTSVTLVL